MLLGHLRSFLKSSKVTDVSKDLSDRITFILSVESGFLWSDIYASTQLDTLAQDFRVPSVLNKQKYGTGSW